MRLLLIMLLLFGINGVLGQGLYKPGDIARGSLASYRYIADHPEIDSSLMIIRNTSNVDTTDIMYYDDGSAVDFDWILTSENQFTRADVAALLKGMLTASEREILSSRSSGCMEIWIVTDKAGNAIELEFLIDSDDPVFARIDPDRLFLIETKLKALLKIKISKEDSKIKNIKHVVGVDYDDFK